MIYNRSSSCYNVGMSERVKFRPLSPVERSALFETRDLVKAMCDLLRMVPGWPVATLQRESDEQDEGAMRRRFFELEVALSTLPVFASENALALPPPVKTERAPLFAEHERYKLGSHYSEHDKTRIRAITAQLVESLVLKGELDPENPEDLKKAIKDAAHIAVTTYNATLEFLAG